MSLILIPSLANTTASVIAAIGFSHCVAPESDLGNDQQIKATAAAIFEPIDNAVSALKVKASGVRRQIRVYLLFDGGGNGSVRRAEQFHRAFVDLFAGKQISVGVTDNGSSMDEEQIQSMMSVGKGAKSKGQHVRDPAEDEKESNSNFVNFRLNLYGVGLKARCLHCMACVY
mgnify:CR=1 FL=1